METSLVEVKVRLSCYGFIVEPGVEKLRSVGIDVRMGSCTCPAGEPVTSFSTLPEAQPEVRQPSPEIRASR
jgi:hypothetical protein